MKFFSSSWKPYKFTPPKLPRIQNPVILAFSCYFHDSSASIIKDGKIVAAIDEERLSRKKHDPNFPSKAIQYCLNLAKVNKVDLVVFYENPDLKWERILEVIQKNPPSAATKNKIFEMWQKLKSKEKIQETFFKETGLTNQIIFLDHHLCHAASSYFVSGFKDAAVVTIDGVGEKVTTSYGEARGNNIQLKKCICFPHSIGLLYTTLTVFLGFKANDHEYKVMGLAPYGKMDRNENKLYKKLSQVIHLNSDGSFLLDMQYFGHENFDSPPYTQDLVDLLEMEPNVREGKITPAHEELAAALQLITEDAVINLLNHVQKETQQERLCLSGGVALNSVLNGKILSHTKFKELFIQPSAGDSGTVIGAAKYLLHQLNENVPLEKMTHSYYGPAYSSDEIEKFLQEKHIVYKKFETDEEMLSDVANLLKEKSIIGWFQGNMEWGPRALGNRSILASPIYSDMRDILNAKVKHRELFRPFAPVVCIDDALKFFHCDDPIPDPTDYMLMVYPIQKEERHKIPTVTHVDGSGRLQTIRKHQNFLYYRLIKKFGEITGVPILVNTSFNIRGEPIVCSPEDAYRCMMGTEIDYLVIDKFLIKRSDNLKDSWVPKIDD